MVAGRGTVPHLASNNGGGTQAPPTINGGTAPATASGLHHMGADVLASPYEVKNYVCEHHKNSVSDP